MAAFSGAIKIGDLNDFIAPSQSCVVSLNGNKIDAQVDHLEVRHTMNMVTVFFLKL